VEIARASDAELCAVFELIKNLVHNESLQLQLSAGQRRLLKRHRNQLRQLIDRKVPKGKKRRLLLLQKGGGAFLPAVLGLLAPLIGKLLGGGGGR
jgi:hypothetical protein